MMMTNDHIKKMSHTELKKYRQKVYNMKLEQRKLLPSFGDFFDKQLKNIRARMRFFKQREE